MLTQLKFKFLIFKITVFLISCSNSYGVNLSEALDATLKNNLEIKLEKSRLETVKSTKGSAVSEFLPDIYATYNKGRKKEDAVGIDRGKTDDIGDEDVKRLSFDQPIFNGFSSVNKLKEVKFDIKEAESRYKSTKDDILLKTVEYYMKLCLAKGAHGFKSDNETYEAKLLRLVKQRNRVGQVGGSEVLNYQSRLFNAKSDKLNARKDLFNARKDFENNIGIEITSLVIPTLNNDKILNDERKLVNAALSNNSNLKRYEFKSKAARSALNQKRGAFSPVVSVTGNLSRQENVTYLNNRDLKSRSIYLNLKVPLFNKGNEYFGLSQAGKELAFARREYALNKEMLIKDVKQTHEEYLFYKDLVNSNNSLIKLAKAKVRKLKQRVRVGRGDVIDLLMAKIELNEIMENELENQVNYVVSYYKLLSFTGDLNADSGSYEKPKKKKVRSKIRKR
jgi:outer membrane protein